MEDFKTWYPFETGKTSGKKGSENGVITLDEEHALGARVTLERDGSIAPWSVTCGIYGNFVHTAFASTEEEGRSKFEDIKKDLVTIMLEESEDKRQEMMCRVAAIY